MVTYQNIVVGTDFSSRSDVALEAAFDMARHQPKARVTLVHVLDTSLGGSALPYDLTGEDREALEQGALDAARDRLREIAEGISDLEVEILVRRGHPAKELARAAESLQADLIVTSTQGFGAIKRAILGSVTTSLLGFARCPVLVVGEDRGSGARPELVMAAVDLSPVSVQVLAHAYQLAASSGRVHVVSIFDEPVFIAGDHPFSLQAYALPSRIRRLDEQREAVEKLAAAVERPESLPYEVEVIPGSPPHLEVLELARKGEPDLIVVGASGHRTWSKSLFGTNAARIIAGCHVPVLVVPDPSTRSVDARPTPVDQLEKPSGKEQMVYGTFEPDTVRSTLSRLVEHNIDPDHISVVMSRETHTECFNEEDQADQGFIAGSAVGTAVGGVLGGLASLAVTGGIGLVVVGPAVALGLIGGLIGTLVSYGVPEHDAARLQDQVERGKVVVGVHAFDMDEVQRAKTALADAGAQPKRLWL